MTKRPKDNGEVRDGRHLWSRSSLKWDTNVVSICEVSSHKWNVRLSWRDSSVVSSVSHTNFKSYLWNQFCLQEDLQFFSHSLHYPIHFETSHLLNEGLNSNSWLAHPYLFIRSLQYDSLTFCTRPDIIFFSAEK